MVSFSVFRTQSSVFRPPSPVCRLPLSSSPGRLLDIRFVGHEAAQPFGQQFLLLLGRVIVPKFDFLEIQREARRADPFVSLELFEDEGAERGGRRTASVFWRYEVPRKIRAATQDETRVAPVGPSDENIAVTAGREMETAVEVEDVFGREIRQIVQKGHAASFDDAKDGGRLALDMIEALDLALVQAGRESGLPAHDLGAIQRAGGDGKATDGCRFVNDIIGPSQGFGDLLERTPLAEATDEEKPLAAAKTSGIEPAAAEIMECIAASPAPFAP